MIPTSTLTSGAVVPTALIATIMISLREWIGGMPGALLVYDVAMMSRDSNYKPFGGNGAALEKAGFLSGGRLTDTVRDIVKCALVGDGMEMEIVSPVKAPTSVKPARKDAEMERRAKLPTSELAPQVKADLAVLDIMKAML